MLLGIATIVKLNKHSDVEKEKKKQLQHYTDLSMTFAGKKIGCSLPTLIPMF